MAHLRKTNHKAGPSALRPAEPLYAIWMYSRYHAAYSTPRLVAHRAAPRRALEEGAVVLVPGRGRKGIG